MVKMNYYNESIKAEADNSHTMDEVYKKYWPNIVSIKINKTKRTQNLGIDKLIYLKDRKLPIRIEEKCRPDKWYGDIALEYISNNMTMTPGWMEKPLLCDYFFYFVKPISQVFWFYWPELKHLWDLNKQDWILWGEQNENGFTKISAPNPGYYTISVGVSPKFLLDHIKHSGIIGGIN